MVVLRVISVLLLATGLGCSGDDSGDSNKTKPAAQVSETTDAGVVDAAAKQPAQDLHPGLHFDSYNPETDRTVPTRRTRRDRNDDLELLLRSSPPGARAEVDGKPVGVTPVLYRAPRDGKARQFTFVRAGYSMARYRFVPTRSGIVHGTLEALDEPIPDAGARPTKRQ